MNSFWERWRKEYLLELREAHRYHRSNGSVQIAVGDIVVVYTDDQPRSHWNLGLVEGVMVGADGEIRAATVIKRVEQTYTALIPLGGATLSRK